MTAAAIPARPVPPRPGPEGLSARLAEILRVDHAGEMAAVAIYRGQRAVMEAGAGRADAAADFARLEAAETLHLDRFSHLILAAGVRPSLLSPVWRAAGFALGAATALIGENAAHACTEAVEAVIADHYQGQIAEITDTAPELAAELSRFRDEEMAHGAQAVDKGAHEAPAWRLLSATIQAGCKVAIKLAEKI